MLTVRTNHRFAHPGTGPVARTERVDDQRRERPDNDGGRRPDGSNGIIAALAGTASGLLIGLLGRTFQRHRGGMAACQSVRRHTRQHEYLLGHRHLAFRRTPGFRHTRGIQRRGISAARTRNTDVRHLCGGRRHRAPPAVAAHDRRPIVLHARQQPARGSRGGMADAAGCWRSPMSSPRY